MLSVLLAAAIVVAASALLGAAIMSLSGARSWHPAAPGVGFGALLLLTSTALVLPSQSSSATLVTGMTVVAATVLVRRGAAWPRRTALAELLPALTLACVPFLVQGRAGTLGVGRNGDMGTHLAYAEGLRSTAIQDIVAVNFNGSTEWYPIGPHSVVAALADLGVRTDLAFSGLSVALCVLLAWSAIGCASPTGTGVRAAVGMAAGVPFLVASYHGQGAFKEVAMALFVVTLVILLDRADSVGRARFVPFAVLFASVVATYSLIGFAWPVAVLGGWACWAAGRTVTAHGIGRLGPAARGLAVPSLVAGAAFAVVVLPHVSRALSYYVDVASSTNSTGIASDDVGNVGTPLSPALTLGFSTSADFLDPSAVRGAAAAIAVALAAVAVVGAVGLLRQGRSALPIGVVAAVGIWAMASVQGQSPYVAAKSLAIASPICVLVAMVPLLHGVPQLSSAARRIVLAVVILLLVGASTSALRVASVGSEAEQRELQSLDRYTRGAPTLFLGHDDFVRWKLLRTPVAGMYPGRDGNLVGIPLRPEKDPAGSPPWTTWALDLDAVEPSTLNRTTWVITTRDAAASRPTTAFAAYRTTARYVLWRRVGTVPPGLVLNEASGAAATYRCESARDRAVARSASRAVVRAPSRFVPVPELGRRDETTVRVPPGRWDVSATYTSDVDIEAVGPQFRTMLPASLGGRGSRWPVGRVVVHDPRGDVISLRSRGGAIPGRADSVSFESLTLSPTGPARTMRVAVACGRHVDHFVR